SLAARADRHDHGSLVKKECISFAAARPSHICTYSGISVDLPGRREAASPFPVLVIGFWIDAGQLGSAGWPRALRLCPRTSDLHSKGGPMRLAQDGARLPALRVAPAFLLVALLVSGCNFLGSGSSGGASGSGPITVAVVPGIDNAPLQVAVQEGLFRQNGLNVVVKDYPSIGAEY